jgi:S-disulfanyl-L-cysteine oxidoreductase SoxD
MVEESRSENITPARRMEGDIGMTRNFQHGLARLAIAASLTVWVAGAARAWSAEQETRSVNDGVYSAAQATRGEQAFEKNCTMCHDTDRFTGDEFVGAWSGQPLQGLFGVMSNTMPEDNPGSLKPQEYGDILAYFLQLNEYPAGTDELKATPEVMKTIKMEARK